MFAPLCVRYIRIFKYLIIYIRSEHSYIMMCFQNCKIFSIVCSDLIRGRNLSFNSVLCLNPEERVTVFVFACENKEYLFITNMLAFYLLPCIITSASTFNKTNCVC